MSITISYDPQTKKISVTSEFDKREGEAILTDLETKAVEIIRAALAKENLSFDLISKKRYSDNYLSLVVPEENDFCRIKAGVKSTWISLDVWRGKAIQDDIRFSHIKNRNTRHWKISLQSVDDISNVTDLIIAVFVASVPFDNICLLKSQF